MLPSSYSVNFHSLSLCLKRHTILSLPTFQKSLHCSCIFGNPENLFFAGWFSLVHSQNICWTTTCWWGKFMFLLEIHSWFLYSVRMENAIPYRYLLRQIVALSAAVGKWKPAALTFSRTHVLHMHSQRCMLCVSLLCTGPCWICVMIEDTVFSSTVSFYFLYLPVTNVCIKV